MPEVNSAMPATPARTPTARLAMLTAMMLDSIREILARPATTTAAGPRARSAIWRRSVSIVFFPSVSAGFRSVTEAPALVAARS
jgi:sugar (pentulose or hexulose) kinase